MLFLLFISLFWKEYIVSIDSQCTCTVFYILEKNFGLVTFYICLVVNSRGISGHVPVLFCFNVYEVRNTILVIRSKRNLEMSSVSILVGLQVPTLRLQSCWPSSANSSNQRSYLTRPTHSVFVWLHMVGRVERKKDLTFRFPMA